MSLLCIIVFRKGLEKTDLNKRIWKQAESYGLGVSFNLGYEEPILHKVQFDPSYVICSLSDGPTCDNCEMLLLPDFCCFNGKSNPIMFCERMHQIECILKTILTEVCKVELFIGYSGALWDEFSHLMLRLDDFLQTASLLNSISPPNLHFVIS